MEDLQDVFAGKIPQNEPQEDVDMDPMEDDVAQVTNASPQKIGLSKPTKAITTVPVAQAQNNFVMDEDGDEF